MLVRWTSARRRTAPQALPRRSRSKVGCPLAIAERLPVADPTTRRWAGWRTGHWATAAAALGVGLVRWLTSWPRTVIHMVPDEPGQLAIARFVGRGLRWNMLNHSTWRPGYGVLLAPATWITDDAVGLYRSGLLLNAGLGALSCVLLTLLAARLTGRPLPTCAALAAAVSLAPALLFTTDWVWSEALVQVTLLLFLLAALRFLDLGRVRWGATMVVAAAAGFATHSRLLPLAVTATVLVVVACWRRHLATRYGVGLLAALALLLLAVARFSSWLVERIWETPAATNTAGGVLDRLTAAGPIAVSGIGQLWYQLVASAGLAGIGAIALVRAASRRAADDRPGEPNAVDARVLLVAIAPLVALSIVFMSDRWRPDQIIYGRYNDPATAVIVLVGLATLLGAGRRRLLIDGAAVIGALVVTAVVLWITEGDELARTAPLRAMVLGVLAYAGREPVHVVAVTLAAGGIIAVLVAAGFAPRRVRGVVLAVVVVALLVTGYVRTRPTVDAALNSWNAAAGLHDVEQLPAGAIVRVRVEPSGRISQSAQRVRLMIYEFYRPDNAFYLDGKTPDGTSSPYVIAPLDDDALRDGDAALLWVDRQAGIGLWREVSAD